MIDNDYNMLVPQGWQCPICKRVYSPSYPWCNFCGNEKTETTTTYTTNVGYIPPVDQWGSTKTEVVE